MGHCGQGLWVEWFLFVTRGCESVAELESREVDVDGVECAISTEICVSESHDVYPV